MTSNALQPQPASPPLLHLLDVNLLLAAIWVNHPQHAKASQWLSGKSIMLCPLAELGFLRISTNRRAINAPMEKARELLGQFADRRDPGPKNVLKDGSLGRP